MKYKILVVDDEAAIRSTISDILDDEGYDVLTAEDGEAAEKVAMIEDLDCVILDVMMPKKNGLEVLSFLQKEFPLLPVIIISGHGDIKMAVEAMRNGAHDFIEKPPSMERIIPTVKNAVKMKMLQSENIALRSKLKTPARFIGESPAVQTILSQLSNIAQSDASVLVTGENGTGKEMIAQLIHQKSNRSMEPFIGVNCAAIPDTLIESELFGYEKGAFTGAAKQKKGKFEAAEGGTIFLDEIGDLSLPAQAKVLRVLQEKVLERVGGNESIHVDVRVVAATNKDLPAEINAGNFRQDLYYRLNVVPIHIPPLRERKTDIPLLVELFLGEINEKSGRTCEFTDDAIELLQNRSWPGNVRELRNFIERLTILSPEPKISSKEVQKNLLGEEFSLESGYEGLSLKEAKRRFETELIINRLTRNEMNITRTAESLGIERTYLHKKIKELSIDETIELKS